MLDYKFDMADCIFCKIAKKEIPNEFVYEDGDIMVFDDINPAKPVHLLIVPKKHVHELLFSDSKLHVKLMKTVQAMVKKSKLDSKGYRVVINGGGAQAIDHLHIHLMGPMGKKADW